MAAEQLYSVRRRGSSIPPLTGWPFMGPPERRGKRLDFNMAVDMVNSLSRALGIPKTELIVEPVL